MGGHDTDQLTPESHSLNADSAPLGLGSPSRKCPRCKLSVEEDRLFEACCGVCDFKDKAFSAYLQHLKQLKEENARFTADDMGGHGTNQLTSKSQSLHADSASGRLVLSSSKYPICCDCVLCKMFGKHPMPDCLLQRMLERPRWAKEETSGVQEQVLILKVRERLAVAYDLHQRLKTVTGSRHEALSLTDAETSYRSSLAAYSTSMDDLKSFMWRKYGKSLSSKLNDSSRSDSSLSLIMEGISPCEETLKEAVNAAATLNMEGDYTALSHSVGELQDILLTVADACEENIL